VEDETKEASEPLHEVETTTAPQIVAEDTTTPKLRLHEPKWLQNLRKKLPTTSECTVETRFASRIFGGVEADFEEYPWTVLLQYKKRDDQLGFHCGGSLINEKWVLTGRSKFSFEQFSFHHNLKLLTASDENRECLS
jgi:hypothetical protein